MYTFKFLAAVILVMAPTVSVRAAHVNLTQLPGATAVQSSTTFSAPASRAIDNNTGGNFFAGSVTHTNNTFAGGEFWEVNLPGLFQIDNVRIFNRTDCCGDRLDPFRLSVFNGAVEVFGQNFAIGGAPPVPQTVDTGDVFGDRVRVRLNAADFLHLAEVQVFETDPIPEPATIALLGLGAAVAGWTIRRRRARTA